MDYARQQRERAERAEADARSYRAADRHEWETRAEAAEAELAKLREQEPVATVWVDDVKGAGVDTCGIGDRCRALGPGEHNLYAAPVPPADHAQALRDARAEAVALERDATIAAQRALLVRAEATIERYRTVMESICATGLAMGRSDVDNVVRESWETLKAIREHIAGGRGA